MHGRPSSAGWDRQRLASLCLWRVLQPANALRRPCPAYPPARKPVAKAPPAKVAPAARTRGKPKPAASGAVGGPRQSPLNFQPSATTQRGGSSQRGTQLGDNSVGAAVARGGSRRAAAAKASERVAATYK